tara:strand:- start:125 stop:508 length:384 start_codon:yes stop_codon:yes gene_type:complete
VENVLYICEICEGDRGEFVLELIIAVVVVVVVVVVVAMVIRGCVIQMVVIDTFVSLFLVMLRVVVQQLVREKVPASLCMLPCSRIRGVVQLPNFELQRQRRRITKQHAWQDVYRRVQGRQVPAALVA